MQGFNKTVTLAAMAAALLMTPAVSASQTPPSQPPATQPPATATPPAQTPQQPPQQTMPSQQQAQPDEQTARRHLTDARNTLSALTQLPEASQLTDEARTQVSQLISNFNELITAQSDWRASYAKVSANLNTLVGPDLGTPDPSGTAGAVGTTGAGGIEGLDPAIRTKLVELRSHLKQFERAAGGGAAATAGTQTDPGATDPTSPPTMTPPAGTPPTTTPPATTPPTTTPPTATPPATAPQTSPATQGTTGTEPGNNAEAMRHIAAIEALLQMQDESGGLTLTKAQVEQLRTHWAALKVAIDKR
jgi:hypothetical protein